MNLINHESKELNITTKPKKVLLNYKELKKGLLNVLNTLKQSINIPLSIKEDMVEYYIEDLENLNIKSFVSYYYNSNVYKVYTTNELISVLRNNPGIEINELLNINSHYSKSIDELIFKNLYIKDNKCYLR